MASCTGNDLRMIERVAVDLGNPLQNTATGRMEMAENLLGKGAITAKQYIQVAATGNIETATESAQSQEELIRKENESLMEGKPVKAIVGDAHLMHSSEHLVVMNDPLLRQLAAEGDQKAIQIVEAVAAHIQEHEMLHQTQTPFFAMLSGEPMPPQPPGPPMPPPPGEPGLAPEPPMPGMNAQASAPPPPMMPPMPQ
jgi:hypothetical protein